MLPHRSLLDMPYQLGHPNRVPPNQPTTDPSKLPALSDHVRAWARRNGQLGGKATSAAGKRYSFSSEAARQASAKRWAQSQQARNVERMRKVIQRRQQEGRLP